MVVSSVAGWHGVTGSKKRNLHTGRGNEWTGGGGRGGGRTGSERDSGFEGDNRRGGRSQG